MLSAVTVRDQSYIKYRNMRSVLALLTERQPISRSQIARLTEMSPTSVTRIVGALLALGLVDETDHSTGNSRGRKAINLHLREDGIYTLGISLEPHRVKLGLVDFGNTILYADETSIEPILRTPEAMAAIARAMYARFPRNLVTDWKRLRGVGVCVAGTVDCVRGIVSKSDQMRWERQDIASVFLSEFCLPTQVENDVKACLMGEKALRGLPDREEVAYLLIGTGVGVAATMNGKLLRGNRNESGEIEGIKAGNGGVLHDHLVETALIRRAQVAEPSVHSMNDILIAYRQDIGWAKILIGDFLRCLKMTLDMIGAFFDPYSIILGGSIVAMIEDILKREPLDPRLSIGNDYGVACMLGAALIAQHKATETMIQEELDV